MLTGQINEYLNIMNLCTELLLVHPVVGSGQNEA